LSTHCCTRPAHPAQVDLALLTVKKAAFWNGAAQLDLGPSPRLQQEVHVIGYPLGGEGVSITAGVVSRVDYGEYVSALPAHNMRRVTVTPLQGMLKARRATSACRSMLPSTAETGVHLFLNYRPVFLFLDDMAACVRGAVCSRSCSGGPALSKGMCVGVAFQVCGLVLGVGYRENIAPS
jgi:hypothetical protein